MDPVWLVQSIALDTDLPLPFKLLLFSCIITKQDNSSLIFRVSADSSKQQLSLEYINGSGLPSVVLVNFSLSDGGCHHVALVLLNSTIQLFTDGQQVAEEITYTNLWNISGNIYLGGVPNGSEDDYFKGKL